MKQYQSLLTEILMYGDVTDEPRTQQRTIGITGTQREYDLREGYPLLTTKNVPLRLVIEELFWKLRGERNVKSLFDANVHIWDDNAFDRYLKNRGLNDEFPKNTQEWEAEFSRYKNRLSTQLPEVTDNIGDLGPVYGFQWRHWKDKNGNEVDQLEKLIDSITNNPGGRYHTLSSWNVGDLPEMALGPCPMWHQFSDYGEYLDLVMFQRSCDTFLGVPFNMAQDSALLHLVAKEVGLKPRKFAHHFGNLHIYLGVEPRSGFWTNKPKVQEFRERLSEISERIHYADLRDWYIKTAPPEDPVNEHKDHVPFVLTQLSKTPRDAPELIITKDVPLIEAIKMPAQEVMKVKNYKPHKWDARARMAA
jgi:thymidylate synthase